MVVKLQEKNRLPNSNAWHGDVETFIQNFHCKICDYKAVRICDLKKHISYAHEGMKSFRCNICDYENAQKRIQIESVHKGINPFECSI
jgi:hypothetical protein